MFWLQPATHALLPEGEERLRMAFEKLHIPPPPVTFFPEGQVAVAIG
ncbi:hypothetical protein ECDEC3E_5873 [Escherichia coli DEC3E]|nr:hypothetical protein ECRM13516_5596 [Escherichia coli O145:H28 str. RM13516]AHY68381.1 hypothetical protein ECRM12761_27320 [Escherichia coli O145:H28 str. RM12761]EHU69555.1 hypothetical protein ECDEC3E_5873 [Escherichia coli DEC3E]